MISKNVSWVNNVKLVTAAIFKSPWRREPHPIKSHFAWDQLNKTWLDGGQPADTDVALGPLYRFDKKYSMCTYMHCREFLVMTIFKLFFLFYPSRSIQDVLSLKHFYDLNLGWCTMFRVSTIYPCCKLFFKRASARNLLDIRGILSDENPLNFNVNSVLRLHIHIW